MRNQALQQAARAAFSAQDWFLLTNDAQLLRGFIQLSTIEEVEEFIYEAHDRLRSHREMGHQHAACNAAHGFAQAC
jgi:hypothetical protein